MNSAKAHGFLIAGLINDHLWPQWRFSGFADAPEGSTNYMPCCCGPCSAMARYFNTPRGRTEADTYILALGKDGGGYCWQLRNGKINWDAVERLMSAGWCPNHEEGKRR